MSPMATPECLYIGDDFTGASDTLATYGRGGLKTRLFLEPPSAAEISGLNAIGIATALRSLSRGRISEELNRMLPALAASGARYFHYKTCSTFDSSPDIGSIGAAVTAMSTHLEPALILILGGQPSLGRYCAFGHLFARTFGGDIHRIDRHPVMARHPVTPMHESDLRMHLARQGLADISLITAPEIDQGTAPIIERLSASTLSGGRIFLFDTVRQDHVAAFGEILHGLSVERPLLLVGASGVAEALTGADQGPTIPHVRNQDKHCRLPTFVFAGSRSSVTRSQVFAARAFHRLPLGPHAMSDPDQLQSFIDEGRGHLSNGTNLLAHLLPEVDYRQSPEDLAERSAHFVAGVAEGLELAGLGIAGGDTSSIATRRLGVRSLSYLGDADRGVAICRAQTSDTSMMLMLKGGQMGGEDLFDRFAFVPPLKQ